MEFLAWSVALLVACGLVWLCLPYWMTGEEGESGDG